MEVQPCGHVASIDLAAQRAKLNDATLDALRNGKTTCGQCSVRAPDLWVCLGNACSFIGCGRAKNQHMKEHFEASNKKDKHAVCINATTTQIWCYLCDDEVLEGALDESAADSVSAIRRLMESRSSPRPVVKKRKQGHEKYAGLAGLANLGNTCYMNAALQCLSNTPPLAWHFRSTKPRLMHAQSTAPLVQHFSELLSAIWSGEYSELAPTTVVRDIKRANPLFQGYGQQDSQEFLRCILDRLHEHMKELCDPPYPEDDDENKNNEDKNSSSSEKESEGKEVDSLSNGLDIVSSGRKRSVTQRGDKTENVDQNGDNRPKKKAKKETRRYYRSIISDVFEGVLLSRVTCMECGYTSSKKDPFWDLSVSIPDNDVIRRANQESGLPSAEYGWGSWLSSMFTSRTLALDDCLRAFCMKEDLTGSERYRCERCKKRNDSQKYMRIIKPPEVLCVHIKRFRHDAYIWTKSTERIQFPLQGFDIEQFCESDYKLFQDERQHTQYDLIGTIRHMGIMSGGHYIAYAYNQKHQRWYEFDDRSVSPVSQSTVENAEAYVLFFRRRIPEREEERRTIKRQVKDYAKRADNAEGIYYLSRKWWTRWKILNDPGPIDNKSYVCPHDRLARNSLKSNTSTRTTPNSEAEHQLIPVPTSVWKQLIERYGGGPALRSLMSCEICDAEAKAIEIRRTKELSKVRKLDASIIGPGEQWYLINTAWLNKWKDFVNSKRATPPGPISNHKLLLQRPMSISPSASAVAEPVPRPGLERQTHYRGLTKPLWDYYISIYGGGPALPRLTIDIYNTAHRAEKKASPLPQKGRTTIASPLALSVSPSRMQQAYASSLGTSPSSKPS